MHKFVIGATALALLATPALAQDKMQDKKTLNPNDITVDSKRPTLELGERQRAVLQDGLETVNTQQKTPKDFEPKVGETIPSTMTVDVIPENVFAREPSLKQYGYAKLNTAILVLDPVKKTIIAILPLKTATNSKDKPPADWAGKQGRELTGQAPETSSSTEPSEEPAGDSGDKSNGNEQKTQQNK